MKEHSATWRTTHENFKKKLGIEVPANSYVCRHSIQGLASSERVAELLDIVREVQGADAPHTIVDVSQCLSRKPYSTSATTVTRTSEFYSFSLHRMVTPVEHMVMLGFDVPSLRISHLAQSCIKDLSEDAMACPSIACALLALLSSVKNATLFAEV